MTPKASEILENAVAVAVDLLKNHQGKPPFISEAELLGGLPQAVKWAFVDQASPNDGQAVALAFLVLDLNNVV